MIVKPVKTVLEILNLNGYEAYIVGGAVRSMLLNVPIEDYDITTNADPNAIKLLFQDYTIYDIGKKHGTVTVLIDRLKIDITPFRKESNYFDHRHPSKVEFTSSLVEDVKRRDFTINALCMDKDENIIDLFDGIHDLNRKLIKGIGNPEERFNEDALRILRALRFKTKLNFDIEENTKNAIFDKKELLKVISNERKKEELLKILSYENVFLTINEFIEVFNTFISIDRIDTNLKSINCFYSLALLISGKNINLKELKFSSKEIDLIHYLIQATDIDINDSYAFIKALSNIYESDVLNYVSWLNNADLSSQYTTLKKYIVTLNDLDITGDQIQEYGYKGRVISIVKNKLLDSIHRQELENKNECLKLYLSKNKL